MPKIKLGAFMIDCKDLHELASFYSALLQWEIVYEGDEYAVIFPPDKKRGTYLAISFQQNPDYVPPVWPTEPNAQQQMAHLDFNVDDLQKAVQHAINCGARIADKQFSEKWTVLFDPAGHPFCLVQK